MILLSTEYTTTKNASTQAPILYGIVVYVQALYLYFISSYLYVRVSSNNLINAEATGKEDCNIHDLFRYQGFPATISSGEYRFTLNTQS